MDSRAKGYAAILTAAFLLGMWATVGKIVVLSIPPLTAALFVQAIGMVVFLPWIRRSRLRGRDLGLTALAAFCGAFAAPIAYFVGLALSTPVNAALLSNSEAMFTMFLAFLVLRERLPRWGYVAAVVILVGATLVVLDLEAGEGPAGDVLLGNGLLVLAALLWAADNNIAKVLTARHEIRAYIPVKLLLGTAMLAPVVALAGRPLTFDVSLLPIVLFLALTGTALFMFLFYYSLQAIGTMRTGALLSTSAGFGVVIAVLVLATPVTPIQLLGGALMAVAVLSMYRQPEAATKR